MQFLKVPVTLASPLLTKTHFAWAAALRASAFLLYLEKLWGLLPKAYFRSMGEWQGLSLMLCYFKSNDMSFCFINICTVGMSSHSASAGTLPTPYTSVLGFNLSVMSGDPVPSLWDVQQGEQFWLPTNTSARLKWSVNFPVPFKILQIISTLLVTVFISEGYWWRQHSPFITCSKLQNKQFLNLLCWFI